MTIVTMASLVYVLLSVCAWIIYLNLNSKRPGNLPPGPKGYPFVGNVFQIDRNQLWNTLVKWKREYGDIVYFRLFNQNIIVLNSGRVAADILDRRAANYSKRPRMPVVNYLTGGLDMVLMDYGNT
ncbi:cytochrome p450 [Moniliophthora roreri MCA 2997]|uniref:Cytochrome p450 n=1 Tax=Moniliophthora roreri (strain MCA 2997) TaxID=1381753 RepID=V2X006_MONRO|nr:cytochrome p450 [Moniliophthora roreri MCA 2997]